MRNAVEEEGIFLAYSVMSLFPPEAVTEQQNHCATASYKFLSFGSLPSSRLVILSSFFLPSALPLTRSSHTTAFYLHFSLRMLIHIEMLI